MWARFPLESLRRFFPILCPWEPIGGRDSVWDGGVSAGREFCHRAWHATVGKVGTTSPRIGRRNRYRRDNGQRLAGSERSAWQILRSDQKATVAPAASRTPKTL